ncbi:MAG: formylmethanofuran dehydrogenase subunit B [Planctomycetes bacterium]|nr:formylmethanofuran dehydrogenase subunit B [Planctomycetota bacterium]
MALRCRPSFGREAWVVDGFPMTTSGPRASSSLNLISDAVCARCGCACDDIELLVEANRVREARNACPMGAEWFLASPEAGLPKALIGGREASLDAAVAEAGRILSEARFPLVHGLANATCEAQRVAVSIADRIGACLDTAMPLHRGLSGMAFQGVGEIHCSLGEVKNRADLVIFWGCDPGRTHPRHGERYSIGAKGLFTPLGRQSRRIAHVDLLPDSSGLNPDLFVPLEQGKDFEALWTLRALLRGHEIPAGACPGAPLEALRALSDAMKGSRFGVLFLGTGTSSAADSHMVVDAALAMALDLNRHSRFYVSPMRGGGNPAGADNVVTWQTGYPFGVHLGRGYPRFNPGEFSTEEVLSRGEADAALVVAADPASELNPAARKHLAEIGVVALDYGETETTRSARVSFMLAPYGLATPGTIYRMDDVSLPARPAVRSAYPSAEEVLRGIARAVGALP